MSREAHLVWEVGAELGEGPVWDERDQALWFTDIKRKKSIATIRRAARSEAGIRPSRSASCSRRRRRIHCGLAERPHRFDPRRGRSS